MSQRLPCAAPLPSLSLSDISTFVDSALHRRAVTTATAGWPHSSRSPEISDSLAGSFSLSAVNAGRAYPFPLCFFFSLSFVFFACPGRANAPPAADCGYLRRWCLREIVAASRRRMRRRMGRGGREKKGCEPPFSSSGVLLLSAADAARRPQLRCLLRQGCNDLAPPGGWPKRPRSGGLAWLPETPLPGRCF